VTEETFELLKMILSGADGALVVVLLYSLNRAHAWTKRVEDAIENIERLNKIVEDNQADIAKLRRMYFALKDQLRHAKDESRQPSH
jgi:acetyl esterase/lipase|tara:strand:+ start:803 stop:1060 length:258 start_codon:yes stop_codon:yes gene_type:complete